MGSPILLVGAGEFEPCFGLGSITEHIEQGVRSRDTAIAVLDSWRPNLLYELGFAHALRKPLILLLQHREVHALEDAPFDISTLHRLEYNRPIVICWNDLARWCLRL